MRGYAVGMEASILGEKELQFFDVIVRSEEALTKTEVERRATEWLEKNYNKVQRANVYHVDEALPIIGGVS